MRTTTTAPKKAATAKRNTISEQSGESKSAPITATATVGKAEKINPITVSIGGEFAEKLRAEASLSGLIPLSLIKQRLRIGGLLTDDTVEGKEFRMDVAEKAFQESGRYLVPHSWDPADVPPGCVMARVRPCDARAIRDWARTLTDKSPEWIVASVFASIGDKTLEDIDASAAMKSDTSGCVWRCIHRDEKLYTETIPVFFSDYLAHVTETAVAMRRDLGDWLARISHKRASTAGC